MNTGEPNSVYSRAFVDELARSGLRHAVVSPGSRSTPLAMALAEHPGVRVWMNLDERSAAFFALGMAKASRQPVAVLCTSGTAAANFLPAVVEARYARVPLIVLTADRPPELRDCGAPQAIDQIKLYGDHVKWHTDMAVPEASEVLLRYARVAACRAHATALASPAGPVHLNFSFREPLLPDSSLDLPITEDAAGSHDGRPYVSAHIGRRHPQTGFVATLAEELACISRGLIVCGPQDDPDLPAAVAELAQCLGYPVLADPLSGARCGQHDRSLVIDAYDAILRDPDWVAAHSPDAVLRFGAMPTSKPLTQYLGRYPDCRQIVVDEGGGWRDSTLLASDMVYADSALFCAALSGETRRRRTEVSTWAAGWIDTNARARQAIQEQLAGTEELFEGRIFAELAELLPPGAALYAGNSMPVRDLDTFFPSVGVPLRVLGNRGANGIDGVVSSALGACAVSEDGPVVLVIGDLSFYHDMNGLLAAKLHGLNLKIVLLNNDGGGIFSFLPQAAHPEHFEELFGTPHGLDLGAAARMYGGVHAPVSTWPDFRDVFRRALDRDGLAVVEVRTDRERNVALHREVTGAVRGALAVSGAAGAGR